MGIDYLVATVFNDNRKNVLTKKEITSIERYYKKNYLLYNTFESFYDSNSTIKSLISKLKAGKNEIQKQITNQRALQSGILAECVFIQTLADMLNINQFCDLEDDSTIPNEVSYNLNKVQSKAKAGNTVRYVYYNSNDYNNIIFQCGNPYSVGDATAIINGERVVIEIKDIIALLQDKDLEYDEDGHILITEELEHSFSDYIPFINDFNSRTTMFNEFGHNCPILSNADVTTKQHFLSSYTNSSPTDILMTSYKNKLVAIKSCDLTKTLSDGSLVLSTKGSEIRTTGKNSTKVFTPNYLMNVLSELDVTVIDDMCYIDKKNTKVKGFVKGRGTTKATRFKINNCFFVRNDGSLIDCGDYYKFNIKDILQSKGGISIHISLSKNKSELKKELNY